MSAGRRSGARDAGKHSVRFHRRWQASTGRTLHGHAGVAGLQKAWRISNENDKFSVSMITNAVESPNHPHHRSLVFLEAGGPKLLVELWPEAHSGRGVPKSTVKQTLVAGAGKQVEVAAE
jgi:hypothetical protein